MVVLSSPSVVLLANWKPNSNLKQYLKVKKNSIEENYILIEKHNFFEELQFDDD
jgi:hypothetical protein